MKQRYISILGVVAAIVMILGIELWEGPQKDGCMRVLSTTLCRSCFVIPLSDGRHRWFDVMAGKHVYTNIIEKIESEQEESKLVYMENMGDGGKQGQEQMTEEDAVVISSGEASAVMGENLKQVVSIQNDGAGTAAYVRRLKETKDVNYLWNHFYIVDSTTSVTKKLFPVEQMLTRNLTLPQEEGKKQILIYHTHGASEWFRDSRKQQLDDSIVGVGAKLAEELEKQGYGVIHDKTRYDMIQGKIDRNQAYNMSLEGVEKILRENPNVQVIIDLHRDSVGKNKHTYTMVDGRKTAIVMFFNGMSRTRKGEIGYLKNPNLTANLSFSLQLKCRAMECYEGFTKPIYLKGYRYNLHLKERALLVELGNQNNTVEEAKNATIPLAKVIADVLKGV